MKEIVISSTNAKQRADKFVRKYLSDAPLSFIYKLFRIKDVKVNDKRIDGSYILNEGDVVKIYVSDKQLEEFSSKRTIVESKDELDIIYEDDNVLIVNKPSGKLIHGDSEEKRVTLTNNVLNYLYKKGEYEPNKHLGFTPSPAHRLDRNTSGLVIYGKNIASLQALEDLFKDKKELKKEYIVLVAGRLFGDGKIDAPLLKNEKTKTVSVTPISKGGKTALTLYNVVETFKDCTLVNANIITGRTHQIRVHFASISHPVLGDKKYGNFNQNKKFEEQYSYKNQFLHAHKLSFFNVDGVLKKLANKTFVAKLPDKEEKIIESLRRK